MKYNINPCVGCAKKYQNSECNINELNDCVVSTATAFNSVPSNNSIRGTEFSVNWKDCMEQRMLNMPKQAGAPRDFSNLQINMAPRWVQVPHYFPNYLKSTGNVDKSLDMCLKSCSEDSRHVNSCKINCMTDYNSVEKPQQKAKILSRMPSVANIDSRRNNRHPNRRRSSANFTILLSIIFIILIVILSIVLSYI